MGSRFVQPESRKLDISNGDWLIVRKRLTTGERRDAYRRTYVENSRGEMVSHSALSATVLVTAYLLDWSLADAAGQQMAIQGQPWDVIAAYVDALDPVDFTEIRDAIEAHQAAMTAEREAQKKTRSGAMTSSPTSGLPLAVDGPLRTSETLTLTSATS
jgi:hypothetical protein